MNKYKEQSKEMAAFCQQEAKKTKRVVFRSLMDKAVLQGVIVALLVVSSQIGPGDSLYRSSVWVM